MGKHCAILLQRNNSVLLELPEEAVWDRLELLFSLGYSYEQIIARYPASSTYRINLYIERWPLLDVGKPLRALCEFLNELGMSNEVFTSSDCFIRSLMVKNRMTCEACCICEDLAWCAYMKLDSQDDP